MQPTQVFLPGESHGRRSLVGYTVHGVAKSRTRLSNFTFTFTFLSFILFASSIKICLLLTLNLFLPKFLLLMVLKSTFVQSFIPIILSASLHAQSCLIFCNPLDCSSPGSSVHGTLQARILEWVAISSSRRSSPPRDLTCISYTAGFFTC